MYCLSCQGVHIISIQRFAHSSPSDMVHCRLWAESTVALDHLQDEQVAVSETDKEVWITGRRVHALQETLKSLDEVCVSVCVCV